MASKFSMWRLAQFTTVDHSKPCLNCNNVNNGIKQQDSSVWTKPNSSLLFWGVGGWGGICAEWNVAQSGTRHVSSFIDTRPQSPQRNLIRTRRPHMHQALRAVKLFLLSSLWSIKPGDKKECLPDSLICLGCGAVVSSPTDVVHTNSRRFL